MIKIENTHVCNWEAALRGMRNPKNSWDKSDSVFYDFSTDGDDGWGRLICHDIFFKRKELVPEEWATSSDNNTLIGPNDLKLAKALVAGGSVHAKFRRMIIVSCDITAPLYWWKDFDTYRIGRSDETTGAYNPHDIEYNGCSTMHKIHAKEFTLDDFSTENLHHMYMYSLKDTIIALNNARNKYLETHDKDYWWQMIQLLPSSYNQKRTVTMNYEVLAGLYPMRKDHKLDEFRDFCAWIETLPYAKELIIGGE
jgi:hypothetical protein